MPLTLILAELEHTGVNCDVQLAQKLELLCYRQLQEYDKYWNSKLPGISWQSPQQLLLMFQKLGLPIQYKVRVAKDKSRKRTPCVDADVLELYRDGYKNQLANLILTMRSLKKAADFCKIYSNDGRSHSRYKDQRGGRIQALNPDLQNIPEELSGIYPRTIILPDDPERDVIISADFEALEFFIYGYAADDRAILDARRKGIYIYGIFYEEIFHRSFFQPGMPPKKMYRRKDVPPWELLVAKSGPLGLLYGRGITSLEKGFGIRKLEAKRIYDTFHSEHPGVGRHHAELLKEARQSGYVKNYFGRIRRFPNVEMGKNEILSFTGQSNGADILKKNALVKLVQGIDDFKGRLMLTVHDSIAVSVPRANMHGAVEFVRDCMEAPLKEMNSYWIPAVIKVSTLETSTTAKPNWHDSMVYEDWLATYGTEHPRTA